MSYAGCHQTWLYRRSAAKSGIEKLNEIEAMGAPMDEEMNDTYRASRFVSSFRPGRLRLCVRRIYGFHLPFLQLSRAV